MTIRDTIDRAIGEVVRNASNFPERVQARLLGQNMAPLRTRLTDAVLAALSSPPADDERRETFNAMRRLDDEIHSSPPADDVREALREIIRGGSYSRFPDDLPYADVVDRILSDPRFEVRLRGTVTEPTVEEWTAQMDAERARQIEHGYDDAHDAERGISHLLNWSIDYARRGNGIAAATLARCALHLARGTVTDTEVEAAWQSILTTSYDVTTREDIRLALEAARGARVSAEKVSPAVAAGVLGLDRTALRVGFERAMEAEVEAAAEVARSGRVSAENTTPTNHADGSAN